MKTGVAYFGNRMLAHVAHDLADMVAHGCTFVIHTFSENDWMFYHGTMKEIVELSHQAGLEAWIDPWGVGQVFGGEAYSLWTAEHPDLCQRDAQCRHIPAACLNQPSFRRFIHAWVDAALELKPDMIFWDEPHLFVGKWCGEAEQWSCLCDICRDIYRWHYGASMPAVRNDPSVQQFRAWTLLDFLTDAVGYAHSRGARNAICLYPEEVMPDPGPAWSDIAQIRGLDNLGTDPYPFTDSYPFPPGPEWRNKFLVSNAEKIARLTREHKLDNHFWIQAFRLPADGTRYVESTAQLATRAGITNLAAWGYEACAHMSSIASERPKEIWETLGHVYRELHVL